LPQPGDNLAPSAQAASGPNLPSEILGTSVTVTDSAGISRTAPLYYVSPSQVNYVLPSSTATGPATVTIVNSSGQAATGSITVAAVAPGLFTMAQNGTGVAAAQALRTPASGQPAYQNIFECDRTGHCQTAPIDLGPAGDQVLLVLYGTGIRGRNSLAAVHVTLGSTDLQVLYAGPQGTYEGLDQINVLLPTGLNPNQLATVAVTIDGVSANTTPLLLSNGGTFPEAISARFDPADPSTGPFPTDFLSVPDPAQRTGLRVALPMPDCNTQPSSCAETALLNQLDGFNLQPRIHVRFSSAADPDSLRSGVFVYSPDDGSITAINQVVYDPTTNTAYAKTDRELDQDRPYAILVTDGVRDPNGIPAAPDPAFRLCVTSPQNAYCTRLAAIVATAASVAAPQHIVGASVFTTLSATAWTEDARVLVQNTNPNYQPEPGKHVIDVAGLVSFTYKQQVAVNPPQFSTTTVPFPAVILSGVGQIAFGAYDSPHVLNAQQVVGQTGISSTGTDRIHFHVYLPGSGKPSTGYPVVIFGHGYTDNSYFSPSVVAGNFAQSGFATIAINAYGHGSGPQSTVVFQDASGSSEILSGGRGVDVNGDNQIDAAEGCLTVNPPVALRDCIRQTVLDLEQLVHVIQGGIDLDGDGTADLDPSRIYYSGISLGSIYGTVFTAVEAPVRAAGLTVGGGPVVDIARWSKSYHSDAIAFLSSRTPSLLNNGSEYNDDYVLHDQPAKVVTTPGAIAIQNYFELSEWLQITGDPLAYAPHLKPKPVLWQFARGDESVPNPTNSHLIREAGMQNNSVLYRADLARNTAPELPENPHSFLADFTSATGLEIAHAAQQQIAGFLKSDGTAVPDANTATVQALFPGQTIFERAPALPEDLGFK